MTEIIPAIMPHDRSDLEEKVARAIDLASVLQIDVTDGAFVKSKSWPYLQGGHQGYDDDFLAILREDDGLPSWQNVDYEIDLMVADPEQRADDWIMAGAKRLILHLESQSAEALLALVRDLRERFPRQEPDAAAFTPATLDLGIAFNPDLSSGDAVRALAPFVEAGIDIVQCMGIERIGYQHQPFDERVIEHVAALRKAYPRLILSVDGGVDEETAPRLAAAGADRLISGHALFEADDIAEAFRALEDAANPQA